MTTETETKPVVQNEEKKDEAAKEEVKKEEETKNTEEKSDDKAEKTDKEKKDEDKKKEEKCKKEPAPPKPTVHKLDYEKDIIYLYQFTRTPVLPSLSPYCLKVETWLRLAGLKYENVDHKMKYRSKKGQLPFVEINGEEVADSAIIIKELDQRNNVNLDACLSAEQRNVAHANISMIENHFSWVVKNFICDNPENLIQGMKLDLKHYLGKSIPTFLLNFMFKRKLKAAAKKVRAHGIGVHEPEEIEQFGHNDLKVLSDLLGDKPFFFGDEPTNLDVVAFANLAQVVFMDKDVTYSLRDWMIENCSNLEGFCLRMKDKAFPDWDEMCQNLDMNSHLPKPPPPAKEEEKKEEVTIKETKVEKDVEQEKKEAQEENKEKDEKEKDDSEKEKLQKDEKEAEKEDNKKAEEKEKEK